MDIRQVALVLQVWLCAHDHASALQLESMHATQSVGPLHEPVAAGGKLLGVGAVATTMAATTANARSRALLLARDKDKDGINSMHRWLVFKRGAK